MWKVRRHDSCDIDTGQLVQFFHMEYPFLQEETSLIQVQQALE